jgi:hypothetical protein
MVATVAKTRLSGAVKRAILIAKDLEAMWGGASSANNCSAANAASLL